ncbi:hypothetical protein JG687_00011277 [Phytophthora cactorum]|uniref:PWWP domain-containing protein n=2 Tax=Phytophthora cactorum TaxID=29920 RepID=A0A8T1U4R5_9STRA|nr:hypothetical protein JG687_00011277 [Phytophthora cactorum]
MNAELTAPALQEGDWLDVVDDDGIWNVAQVLRLPTPETVEVTYDCWGDEYNEELRRDSERIAPFQTHTWAVKCWAKLDTWPWWPALLTVRAPGSAQGSQNLRLEGRLLVDFLDKVECWVEKHKVVAFQSDEEAREILTKLKKKKNKSRGGVRLKNLALSTELLAMCDAREDFPEFVEGTLPVQFQDKFTRPTAENAHRTPPTSHARHAPRAEKDRSLPAIDRSVQQISAAATSSKSIADDDTASPMTNLARLTKATVRADAILHDMETALVGKLTELAEKSAKVEALRNNIRGLELVLDDIISKDLNQSLSAATTPAELDAIKAELLKSPEVQAAIARIQHPSYATVTQDLYCVSGLLPREASSLSGDNSRRAWEKAKSRFNNLLLDAPPADQSSFGFSVNDNFSMNQWYRDLYPKTFAISVTAYRNQARNSHWSTFPIVMADSTTPTLFACALDVLTTGDAFAKADKTTKYVAQWKSGEIKTICNEEDDLNNVPDHPARPENVEVVPAHKAKQGSRKAFVHSLVHAESYAIDLMWDIVARFVPHNLPRAFYDDWVRVAGEEAEHFNSWAHRLTELGSFYGDLAGHEGLWDAAYETRESILARLAVVHLVHEARGLDVFPNAVKRFEKASDDVSLKIIHKNYNEETTHVGAGVRWFRYVCERDGNDPIAKFHEIVPQYYKGTLKPPFNKEARDKADMLEEWYLPLSTQALAATDKHSAGAATVEETTAAISSMKLDAASS